MASPGDLTNRAKPFLLVILMQFGYAGMAIISKNALNNGMSQHVLVVYRHLIATLVIAPFALFFDRKTRPKMTLSIFVKIALLGLLEPVIDQNLYYTGMKLTTATFSAAMCNILPAFAFLMAWVCRLESVNIRRLHSIAKISGTIVTVAGAMLMALIKGPILNFPWTNSSVDQHSTTSTVAQEPVKGAIFITFGCLCWSSFIILQAITLKSYPAKLTLTALICFMGAMQGSVLAVIMERGNPSAWSIGLDSKLVAVVYSGVISSGLAYYIQGVIMQTKGPVFVTSFNPLSMVLVAILGSFILREVTYLGRVIGAVVIVSGLYLVLWGKIKDDQPPSNGQELMTDNQTIRTPEFVAIDVTKVMPIENSEKRENMFVKISNITV